ncbi:MAG: S41 family peptidase [Candidatus Eremiobacteraeota bacterium]|nr:S41 family peptidase [Candidatus Eremiobacteraeota bacterium]
MPVRFRALLAALVVAVVALAGALFLGYRSGLDAGAGRFDGSGTQFAALDLTKYLSPQMVDEHLVTLAYRQVERVYYKPVDASSLLDGERSGILAFLKTKAVGTPSLPAAAASGDRATDVRKLDRVLSYAQATYGKKLGKTGNTEITQAAMRGMLSSLKDPYTVYLSPQEIQSLNESLDGGNFGGIGVYILPLRDGEILLQPIEGMPASRAGMKPAEILVGIDNTPIKGLSLDKVERLIRGPQGTPVTLHTHTFRKTAPHKFTITREIIRVPTVHARMENGYDYVRLSDFGTTSADEVRKALLDGKAHGAKGYILDLRDNGGGLLDAAVKISSLFIPQGTIVSTINREGDKDTSPALGTSISGLRPLVVLVNKYTASASEITSGAIQDYKVGTLIGTKTFGKGVVQSIYPMPDNGALKITTARYVTPSGRDIQHKGIVPDVVVPQDPDPSLIDTPRDKQLAAAKARLAQAAR